MSNELERKVELMYNEYKFDFQFKRKEKIGKIQEDILSKVSLMIYNIEYTKVFFDDGNEYIMGDEKMLFLDKWENFEEKEEMKMKKIEKIVVYDRKRDENGNVIKDNKVIEQFNRYIQCEETERYIENMNRMIHQPSFIPPAIPLQHSNITFHQGSFARSLMSDLLRPEFLRSFQNTIFTQREPIINHTQQQEVGEESLEQEVGEESLEQEVGEESLEQEEGESQIQEGEESEQQKEELFEARTEEEESNIDNIIQNELSSLVNVVNEYVERTRNRSQVRVRMSGFLNQNSIIGNFESNLINEMNNPFLNISINMMEEESKEEEMKEEEEVKEEEEEDEEVEEERRPVYSANNILFGQPRIVRLPLDNTSILQNHTNLDVLENLMTSLFGAGHFEIGDGQGGIYDDVKICLDEKDFETELEHFEYKNKENEEEENKECIICTDTFKEGDLVSKTRCGHIFHDDCLKPWLLNQSVKCPVCRTEVAKGKPLVN